jgi:hypothetical protein
MSNPIRVSRRRNKGVHIKQGSSFLLLSRDEAIQLTHQITEIVSDDGPRAGAETAQSAKEDLPR